MHIDSRSWHARVYRWWKVMKYGPLMYQAPATVNLCPYVRAVLFWSWSRWLMRSGQIGQGRWALSVPRIFWGSQPIIGLFLVWALAGPKAFMDVLRILAIGSAALSVLSAIVLAVWLIIRMFKTLPVASAMDTTADRALSFSRVLKSYVVGAHNKICPVVEFRDTVEE